MSHDWLLYMTAFATAFGVTMVTTPLARKIAYKFKAVDYPRSRGMNKEPVPLMGGIAIVLGFAISLLITSLFVNDFKTKQFAGFVVGGAIIFFVGMLDDVYELGPKFKLLMQFIVGLVVVCTGTKIDFIMWPHWQYLKVLSGPITIIWIIGLINAVNLIDGLDGLAAGVTSIAAICLMVLCILSGTTVAIALTAALAGACLGFLPRNFSPAEIYMGDTGSTFLGYVLAVASCIGVFKSYAILSIVLSVLAMALPIMDTAFAMIRRAINHKPIMMADRGHLHHRLIDAGYTNKQAVGILYGLSIASGVVAILIAMKDYRATIIVFFFFMILLLMMFAYKSRTK